MKFIKIATLISILALILSGCGGASDTGSSEPSAHGSASTATIEYGMYGPNGDLGSPNQIRIIWHKNTTIESELTLTSNVDTSTDPILESTYGSPHYHYSIAKKTAQGTYTYYCDPAVTTGDWIKYTCDSNVIGETNNVTLDNSFVIDSHGGLLQDTDPYGTGSESLGSVSIPN